MEKKAFKRLKRNLSDFLDVDKSFQLLYILVIIKVNEKITR